MIKPLNTARGVSIALCAFLLMAMHGAVVKLIAQPIAVTVLVCWQFSIALAIILFIKLCKRESVKELIISERVPLLLARALIGLIGNMTVFLALDHLPLIDVKLLVSAAPLWVPIILYLFFSMKVGVKLWVSIVLGFIGVCFILQPSFTEFNVGELYAVLGGVCMALAFVVVRLLSQSETAERQLFYYMGFGMVSTLPFVYFQWIDLSKRTELLLSIGGLLVFFGQYFLIKAMTYIDAKIISPLSYFVIVFAGMLGWVIWDHVPNWLTVCGMFVVVGSGLYTLYLSRRLEAQLEKTRIMAQQ